jgi:hypothetical protein
MSRHRCDDNIRTDRPVNNVGFEGVPGLIWLRLGTGDGLM